MFSPLAAAGSVLEPEDSRVGIAWGETTGITEGDGCVGG